MQRSNWKNYKSINFNKIGLTGKSFDFQNQESKNWDLILDPKNSFRPAWEHLIIADSYVTNSVNGSEIGRIYIPFGDYETNDVITFRTILSSENSLYSASVELYDGTDFIISSFQTSGSNEVYSEVLTYIQSDTFYVKLASENVSSNAHLGCAELFILSGATGYGVF